MEQLPLQSKGAEWLLGFVVPVAVVAVILTADYLEGPKTAYVGVLAVVPMLAAVFARPLLTLAVGAIAWIAAAAFGHYASDGNVTAQSVRLVIIAMSTLVAVGAASLRGRRERALIAALRVAARAEKLQAQADTDELTGLHNRGGLIRALEARGGELERSLAIVDCDNLKGVNDTLGHLAGDEYLRAIGGRIRSKLSGKDVVGRWGGDEFLIVQDLSIERSLPTMERIGAAIREPWLAVPGGQVPAAVSIGIATWPVGAALDDVIAVADRGLYEAKAAGGACLRVGR
jgi:diguanylate cyclase (GGDEF)-like protein